MRFFKYTEKITIQKTHIFCLGKKLKQLLRDQKMTILMNPRDSETYGYGYARNEGGKHIHSF